MREAGQELPDENPGMRILGVPDEEITTVVDVREFARRKMDAFALHVSQYQRGSFFDNMATQIFESVFGTETYILARGALAEERPERSLFADL
jgi:LmbE family N-acetylglucosaminyl deacetylase